MNWTESDLEELRKRGIVEIDVGRRESPTASTKAQKHESLNPLEHVRQHGSGPEYVFAANYLEPRVELGESLGWAHEPFEIRMIGQTYTPDFVEWGTDGITRFYEVKGTKKIGSQDRSSAKYRTTAALFESDVIQFFWAKQGRDGEFRPKKLPKQGKRDQHRFLRE